MSGRSLRRRLLIAAFAFIALALVGAGVALDRLLHRFVAAQIADRLDAQLLAVIGAIDAAEPDDADDPDGADDPDAPGDGAPGPGGQTRPTDAAGLRMNRDVDIAPYDRPLSGWYWTARRDGMAAALDSRSLTSAGLTLALPVGVGSGAPPPRTGDALIRLDGPDGTALVGRTRRIALPDDGDAVRLVATAPAAILDAPAAAIRQTLGLALGALGLLLGLAAFIQVRLGLAPLARLSEALRRVREGEADRLAGPQPAEVQPLVDEIQGLIDRDRARLQRARDQLANLAHGLKTPLATLATMLAGRADVADLVTDLDRRIAHHLRRARAAALAGPIRAPVALAPRVDDLVVALGRIHRDRGLAADVRVPADLWLGCDPLDLDEMLGNLLDNGFKWARSRVTVRATRDRGQCVIEISDDGPGLAVEPAAVLGRGARADAATPGTGFGLPITAELAAMYGGELTLGDAPTGLTATLRLPLAPPPAWSPD